MEASDANLAMLLEECVDKMTEAWETGEPSQLATLAMELAKAAKPAIAHVTTAAATTTVSNDGSGCGGGDSDSDHGAQARHLRHRLLRNTLSTLMRILRAIGILESRPGIE